MNNLENWLKLEKPPATALKTISGGRLKGMTDVNPQWRYKAMTETYGPCGKGWSYTVDKLWIENGVGEERVAFAQVTLKIGEQSIPGIGGSMLIAKETSGLRTNDEAYKMAITDALSVAMKMVGVASAIYEGRWDGSKYKDEPMPSSSAKATSDAGKNLTKEQVQKVMKAVNEVTDWLNNGSAEDAVMAKENADMDADETVFFWSHFDSKQRRAMKDAHAAIKNAELATQA